MPLGLSNIRLGLSQRGVGGFDETGLTLAPDYWIDATLGDDANDGSEGSPWASLSKIGGISLGVAQTRTVRVKAGTYNTVNDYVLRNDASAGGVVGALATLNIVFESGCTMDGTAANAILPTNGFEFSGTNTWTAYVFANGLAVNNYSEGTSVSPNGFGNRDTHKLYVYDADVDNCDDGFSAHGSAEMRIYRCTAQDCEKAAVAHVDTSKAYHYDCTFTGRAGSEAVNLAATTDCYFENCSLIPGASGNLMTLMSATLVRCQLGTTTLAVERTGAISGSLNITDSFVNYSTDASFLTTTLTRCFGFLTIRCRTGGTGVTLDNCVFAGPASNQTTIFRGLNEASTTPLTVRDTIFETASAAAFMAITSQTAEDLVDAESLWEHNILSGSAAFDADLVTADTGGTVLVDNITADALIGAANTLDPDDYGYGTGSPAIGAATDGGNIGFAIGELQAVGPRS